MRFFDWAVGTFAFYGVGLALASFVAGDLIWPLSTASDRLWLILSGMIALGMVIGESKPRPLDQRPVPVLRIEIHTKEERAK
jgi:hypothetical protein